MSGRELVEDLIAARNTGSTDAVAELLRADVRYWDCLHRDVVGRDRIASLLCRSPIVGAELVVDALAVENGHAVAELRASGTGRSGPFELRTTEAYAFADDGIAWCRAYFDPAELPARS
jgi:limonene-1,2-epoxide hydrolase